MKALPTLALLMALGVLPVQAKVVINEIFYHAPNDLEDLQWVELHNSGSAAVDLSGWAFTKGIKFTFPAGSSLPAGGYVVTARNRERFRQFYSAPVAGEFTKALKRRGERLELRDAMGHVVDSLTFDDRNPWPVSADGFTASLERISPEAASGLPENWASSPLNADPDRPGGTPGERNAAFSANYPPVFERMDFQPASPEAGQPVKVEALVTDLDGVREVRLAYRVVEPGRESAEQEVPMKSAGEQRYVGTIPGQPAERLVRFRLIAIDAMGSQRILPGPNEPRPAVSYWVSGPPLPTKLAVARLIHVDVDDFKRAERQRTRGGRSGGMDEEAMLRWNIRRNIRLQADPATLAGRLLLKTETPFDQVARLRPLLAKLLADRDALIQTKSAATDLGQAMQESFAAAMELRRQTQTALQPLVEGPRRTELDAWASGMLGGPNATRSRGEAMLSQMLRPESGCLALLLNPELTANEFRALGEAYRSAMRERETLVDIAASVRDAESYGNLNTKVDTLNDQFREKLAATLPPAQLARFESAQADDRSALSFGASRSGGGLSSPAHGKTALIWTDPGSNEPRVHDFVTLADRKAGYKVHLHRDRTLNGMSGLNFIFEENERMVLAEPLALELYRAAGLPASLADFVSLHLDGHPLGYHLLVEQPNAAFLRRNSLQADGDLFKYLWFEQGTAKRHEKKNNPHRNYDALLRLIEQLDTLRGVEQWALIRKEFDVEAVINYFAVNMLLAHWDGFMNNYFVYHDFRGTGKWMLFPWDQDKTWGLHDGLGPGEIFTTLPLGYGMKGDKPPGWTREEPPKSFFETMQVRGSEWWRPPGYFSGPLLSNPYFRRHYLARVRELLDHQFTEDRLLPRFTALKTQLQEEVRRRAQLRGEVESEALETFERNLETFRRFVVERRRYLLAQPELQSAGAFDRTQLK